MNALESIQSYITEKLQKQKFNWRYILPTPLITVPPNSIPQPISIPIPSDGFVEVLAITGSFTIPDGELPNVAVKISDSNGNGNDLTEGFVDLELIVNPAGTPLQVFYKFNYMFAPSSTMRLEFINRSATASVNVKLAFHSRKLRN